MILISFLSLQVENYRQSLYHEVGTDNYYKHITNLWHFTFDLLNDISVCFQAENLFSSYIPQKITQLDTMLRVREFLILDKGQRLLFVI